MVRVEVMTPTLPALDTPPAPVVGRLAPTPSGYLHVGNARSLLLAWLQIRRLGGRLLLRIEDTDRTRARESWVDAIREDLEWLGLDWDQEVPRQSTRGAAYEAAAHQLEIYGCSCTRQQLRQGVEPGKPALYSGRCWEKHQPLGDWGNHGFGAVQNSWRWHVPAMQVRVVDLLRGESRTDVRSAVGDVVLRRRDGCWSYDLAVVVDDAEQGVTHVLRGEDLWPRTPLHVCMQRSLNAATPRYAHVALMLDQDGLKLSKSAGARTTIRSARESGVAAEQLLAQLAMSLSRSDDAGAKLPARVSAKQLLDDRTFQAKLQWATEGRPSGVQGRSDESIGGR